MSLRHKPFFPRGSLAVFLAAAVGGALLALSRVLGGLSPDLLLFHLRFIHSSNVNFSAVSVGAAKCLVSALLFGGTALLLYYSGNRPAPSLRVVLRLRLGKAVSTIPLFPIPKLKWPSRLLPFAVLIASLISLPASLHLGEYLAATQETSTLFEQRYIDPREAGITFPPEERRRNLILLVLESGESTNSDAAHGGSWDYDLQPELTALRQEHVSFEHFLPAAGTTWTAAGLISQSSGLPMKLPGGDGYAQTSASFLPGMYALGDILHDAGYRQTFLCGSDSEFGDRAFYYGQHGNAKLFDWPEAVREGLLPEDYHVSWGFEDQKLYELAKGELTDLAAGDEPFLLTMLTVDTHFPEMYQCSLCEDRYPTVQENVLSCASRQAGEFIRWIQQQDFYENTTILITGDHLYMDNDFYRTHGVPDEDRRIYNCIINPAVSPPAATRRNFTSFDIFPTALAAIGVTWEGDRLALGTNLFSETPTLVEEMGLEALNTELNKRSEYYEAHFLLDDGA